MSDEIERGAQQEARRLIKEFGDEAPLYAAMKAERAIEQRISAVVRAGNVCWRFWTKNIALIAT